MGFGLHGSRFAEAGLQKTIVLAFRDWGSGFGVWVGYCPPPVELGFNI